MMEHEGITVAPLEESLWERADWLVDGRLYVDVKFMSDGDFNRNVDPKQWQWKWLWKMRTCGGSYAIVNVPRFEGNYTHAHYVNLADDCRLPIVNGLVHIGSGEPVDRNIQFILNLLKNTKHDNSTNQ